MKKKEAEHKLLQFGVRTVDGTATAEVDDDKGDYKAIDEEITLEGGETETFVRIKIIDDEGIEPDEDFYIEIYDLETKLRLEGQDTQTTVTILDDDKPGIFGFETRAVKVRPKDEKIRLKVLRLDGCDEDVKINYKTIVPDFLSNPAEPTLDYLPNEGTLIFESGETMKVVEVAILQKEDKGEDSESIFVVRLFEPEFAKEEKQDAENIEKPKLGKKNECYVEIISDDEIIQKTKDIQEMIQALQQNEEVSWGQQFK